MWFDFLLHLLCFYYVQLFCGCNTQWTNIDLFFECCHYILFIMWTQESPRSRSHRPPATFFVCDGEQGRMTLNFKLAPFSAVLNQHAKYLNQRSSSSKVIVRTRTHTHTHRQTHTQTRPIVLPVPYDNTIRYCTSNDDWNFSYLFVILWIIS